MTSWQIYWLTRLDSFGDMFMVIYTVSLIGMVVGGIIALVTAAHEDEANWTTLKFCGIVWALSNLGWFIPTTKEMAAIIIIPKMVNAIQSNEKITQIPDKVLDLANAWIDELSPKEKK